MDRSTSSQVDGSRDGAALAVLCLAQLMLLLDFSIVNVALPDIARDVGFSERGLQWVVSAYALGFGGLLLLGGRLSDLYGRRRLFVVGLGVFGVTSLVAALSPEPGLLVAMRAAQGIGAALVAPAVLSLITTRFTEGKRRNKALGFFSAAGASGFAVGVLLGGVLVEAFGWRSVLLVNVPLAVILIVAGFMVLDETSVPSSNRELNVLGAVLGTAGLTSVLLGLTGVSGYGFGSVRVIVPLVIGVLALVCFVIHENRTAQPLLPLNLMRRRALAAANGLNLLVPGVVGAGVLLISVQLQVVGGNSALRTGLSLVPLGAVIVIAAPFSAMLTSRFGPKWVLVGGTAVAAVGVALCASISRDSSYAGVALPGLLLTGVGFAAYVATTTIAGTAAVEENQQGLASGLLNTTLQLGTAVGVAILTTVAAGSQNIQNEGYHSAMTVGAVVVLVSAVIAVAAFPQRPAPALANEQQNLA